MLLAANLYAFGAMIDQGGFIEPANLTSIGDMTAVGGLAAAFDGVTAQTTAQAAARGGVVNAFVGKKLGIPRRIQKVEFWSTTDAGHKTNEDPTITVVLRAKTGAAPANRTDGTSIGSTAFTDANSLLTTLTSTDQVTYWDYAWIDISDNGSAANSLFIAELKLYAAAG